MHAVSKKFLISIIEAALYFQKLNDPTLKIISG